MYKHLAAAQSLSPAKLGQSLETAYTRQRDENDCVVNVMPCNMSKREKYTTE